MEQKYYRDRDTTVHASEAYSEKDDDSEEYEGSDEIREMAFKDIDKACLMALEKTIDFIRSSGGDLDEDSIYTRDHFLKMEKEREKNG